MEISEFGDEGFNATNYANKAASTLNEFELRKKINQLRTLQSKVERKMHETVFNNYEKFMEISQTIQKMGPHVTKLEQNSDLCLKKIMDMSKSGIEIKQSLNLALIEKQSTISSKVNKAKQQLLSVRKSDALERVSSSLESGDIQKAATVLLANFEPTDFSTDGNSKVTEIKDELLKKLKDKLVTDHIVDAEKHSLIFISQVATVDDCNFIRDCVLLFSDTAYKEFENKFQKMFSQTKSTNALIFNSETFLYDFQELTVLISIFLTNVEDKFRDHFRVFGSLSYSVLNDCFEIYATFFNESLPSKFLNKSEFMGRLAEQNWKSTGTSTAEERAAFEVIMLWKSFEIQEDCIHQLMFSPSFILQRILQTKCQ